MSAVVCGGGVAGLSTACALQRAGVEVRVLERSPLEPAKHHIGLWSPALRCLDSLELLSEMQSNLSFVCQSSYRTDGGETIAVPPELMVYPSSPSLAFIKSENLMKSLRSRLEGKIEWNSNVQKVFRRGQKAVVELDDNQHFEADFVVAADGAHSTIRKCLHSQSSPMMKFLGYKVFRGHTSFHKVHGVLTQENFHSFQSWGPGKRFAVVPTCDGFAWFAAVSSHESPGGGLVPVEEISKLYSGWHAPIPDIISNCCESGVGLLPEYAYVTSTKLPGWEAILQTEKGHPDYIHANSPKSEMKEKMPSVGEIVQSATASNNVAPLVIYVGDSAGVLDPILAQGAGLAIESGVSLARSISEAKRMHTATDQPAWQHTADSLMNIENMKLHLLDFESARLRRYHRVRSMAALSHTVSHVESQAMCTMRNGVMSLVPRAIKTAFLSKAIKRMVI